MTKVYVGYTDGSSNHHLATFDSGSGAVIENYTISVEAQVLHRSDQYLYTYDATGGNIEQRPLSDISTTNWSTSTSISNPYDATVDGSGNLYIAHEELSGSENLTRYDTNGSLAWQTRPQTGRASEGGDAVSIGMGYQGSYVYCGMPQNDFPSIVKVRTSDGSFEAEHSNPPGIPDSVFSADDGYIYYVAAGDGVSRIDPSMDYTTEVNNYVGFNLGDEMIQKDSGEMVANGYDDWAHFEASSNLTVITRVTDDLSSGIAMDVAGNVVGFDYISSPTALRGWDLGTGTEQWSNNTPEYPLNGFIRTNPHHSLYPNEWAFNLSGQAVQGGSGVSGAKIYVLDATNDTLLGTTTSDANGNWSFSTTQQTTVHVVAEYDDGTDQYNVESYPFIDL